MRYDHDLAVLAVGAFSTVGLYTILYKENRFYRFFEHLFLGLASGWALVAIWTEALKSLWWDKMVGASASDGNSAVMGYWPYVMLLPIGLMGYTVFSKKHNWMSRIPIGVILGLYSGQQFSAWMNRYIPQISGSMKSIVPTTNFLSHDGFFKPDTGAVKGDLYGSEAINNLIFVLTVLCVLSYFLFSFDVKNKLIKNASLAGRWLLMIGFGAIFGTTVMMRFSLLIDRMFFIWIEFVKQGLFLHK
ncbi:MAG: hypothetical protein P4L46_08595 [Fimbriimonas sp.]|nr:hypothetical protein [Fimbriimonas sp.]